MLFRSEEPPNDTIIIFVAQSEENILQTILSRMQLLRFPRLSDENIFKFQNKIYTYNSFKNTHPLLFTKITDVLDKQSLLYQKINQIYGNIIEERLNDTKSTGYDLYIPFKTRPEGGFHRFLPHLF